MATSEGIPSSIDIEFLELNYNPYHNEIDIKRPNTQKPLTYEREWLKGENSINIAV